MGRCYEDWRDERLADILDAMSRLRDEYQALRREAQDLTHQLQAGKRPPVRVEGRETDAQGRTA